MALMSAGFRLGPGEFAVVNRAIVPMLLASKQLIALAFRPHIGGSH